MPRGSPRDDMKRPIYKGLGFLSVDGLYAAMEAGPRDPANPQFTDHYFTGDYPTRLLDREIEEGGRDANPRQLSLLVSA